MYYTKTLHRHTFLYIYIYIYIYIQKNRQIDRYIFHNETVCLWMTIYAPLWGGELSGEGIDGHR